MGVAGGANFYLWLGALIGFVVIGTVVLLMVRRHMIGQQTEDPGGFSTMGDMRAMVDRGEMSKEEYEQVRKAMIEKIRQSKDAPEPGDRGSAANRRQGGTGSTSIGE